MTVRLPECIPHGKEDCSVCLAEAERIADRMLAETCECPPGFHQVGCPTCYWPPHMLEDVNAK